MTTPTVTDAALVAAVAVGDTGALRELYQRHGAWLHARLLRRCPGGWLSPADPAGGPSLSGVRPLGVEARLSLTASCAATGG